jgi:hypothetical protein
MAWRKGRVTLTQNLTILARWGTSSYEAVDFHFEDEGEVSGQTYQGLHNVVTRIESATESYEIALGAFLDTGEVSVGTSFDVLLVPTGKTGIRMSAYRTWTSLRHLSKIFQQNCHGLNNRHHENTRNPQQDSKQAKGVYKDPLPEEPRNF